VTNTPWGGGTREMVYIGSCTWQGTYGPAVTGDGSTIVYTMQSSGAGGSVVTFQAQRTGGTSSYACIWNYTTNWPSCIGTQTFTYLIRLCTVLDSI